MPGLYAGIVLGCIGLILGIIIEICGKFLSVKNNEIIEEIYELLPQINCGACGNPSCMQMAENILKGESVDNCRPCNIENAQIIKKKVEQLKKKTKK